MYNKRVKIQKYESNEVVDIGDSSDNESIAYSGDNDSYDIDDLMIAQSKAQIRSDYRRSLGKEFTRRLK